jgi:hypothetical protein
MMSGKIITAVAAAILLASTGLASAASQAPRHHRQAPRYYNMVPNQLTNDPVPYPGVDLEHQPWQILRDAYPQNGASW